MPKKKFKEESTSKKLKRINRDENNVPLCIRVPVIYSTDGRGNINYDEDEMRDQYDDALYRLPDKKGGPDQE
jgi:hypothetical protein